MNSPASIPAPAPDLALPPDCALTIDQAITALAQRMAGIHDVSVGRAQQAIRNLLARGLIEIKERPGAP